MKNRNPTEQMTDILDCLNSAFKADPNAIHCLISHRIPCNTELAEHPDVVVGINALAGAGDTVGTIGLLNGVLSALGVEKIAVEFGPGPDGKQKMLGFVPYNGF